MMAPADLLAATGIAPAAVAAAVAASVLCGAVGTLVVLRRLVALGGGVAHAAFGGIGAAVRLGFDPRLGAAAVAVLVAAVLSPLRRDRLERHDALIGVLWAMGMAAGMILLAGASGGEVDVEGALFGDVATVRMADVAALAVLDLAVLALLAWRGREIVAVAFDLDHARLRGIPAGLWSFVLNLLVALSVVALLALVGVVLAIALLAIPPLAALRLCRGLRSAMVTAAGIALVTTLGGLALAARWDLPAGPAAVLVGAAILGLAHLVPRRPVRAVV
jgi:zinc transport system permease protein